jgi:hypothetical protein
VWYAQKRSRFGRFAGPAHWRAVERGRMRKGDKTWMTICPKSRAGCLVTVAGLILLAPPLASARDFGIGTARCGDISIVFSPEVLWPPNHKMRTITIQATDNGDSAGETTPEHFSVSVDSITDQQTEASGEGCGNVKRQGADWAGVGNSASGTDSGSTVVTSAQLRAERCAREGERIYDIHLTCTDENGNNPQTDLFVTVPKHRVGQ